MISKQELLKKINEAILREEMAVPIYTQHISSTVHWSGLPKADIQKIKESLQTLHDDSLAHTRTLEAIKKTIKSKNYAV